MGERELTMVNTNIAPQWQRFNGGNWAVLEAAVRTYSARNNRELFIFTGTGNIQRHAVPSNDNTALLIASCLNNSFV
jgi:DNA/RNA endonuclease G (NUC1)